MARVFNTSQFIDPNGPLLTQLYEGRIDKPLAELDKTDLDQGGVIRCMAELRLYHLPPYYSVPNSLKSRLQSSGSLLVEAEDPQNSLILERELCYVNSNLFGGIELRHTCSCGKQTKLVAGACTDCHVENLTNQFDEWKARRAIKLSEQYTGSQLEPHLVLDREDILAFCDIAECVGPVAGDSWVEVRDGLVEWLRLQGGTKLGGENWTSPKKVLLAIERGCSHCGVRVETDFLWSEELEDWEDGLCPECAQHFRTRQSWSSAVLDAKGLRQMLRTVPTVHYERCQYCQKDDFNYAIWGMCEECYIEWQDSYLDVTRLWDLASRHGSLAALLIRPSIDWLNYIRGLLPIKTKQHMTNAWNGDLKELTLRPDTRLRSAGRDPRRTKKLITCADVGVNIDEVLRCK